MATEAIAQAACPGQRRTGSAGADSIAAGSRIGLRGAYLIWAVLWVSSAYLILQALNRAAGALHDTVAGLADGEPGWIAAMDRGVSGTIGPGGTAISIALAVVFLIIAAGVLVPATIRPVLTLAVLTALAMWVAGQNFGGILTGLGTDPNTGLLLVLLAAAFWPLRQSSQIQHKPAAVLGTAGSRAGSLGLAGARRQNASPPATGGQGCRAASGAHAMQRPSLQSIPRG